MTPEAVLFDLDDTLYAEIEFFRSGFAVVARELERRGVDAAGSLAALFEELHVERRERVFDRAAGRLGFPAGWCPELARRFREHRPAGLRPWDGVRSLLDELRPRYRLGLVTDGWAAVQRRKLDALGLAPRLDAVVLADELGGRQSWKPSREAFVAACARLGVAAERAVFVGDHPRRDVAGALAAGLRAVRMRHPDGYFAALPLGPDERETPEIERPADLLPLLARGAGRP